MTTVRVAKTLLGKEIGENFKPKIQFLASITVPVETATGGIFIFRTYISLPGLRLD